MIRQTALVQDVFFHLVTDFWRKPIAETDRDILSDLIIAEKPDSQTVDISIFQRAQRTTEKPFRKLNIPRQEKGLSHTYAF